MDWIATLVARQGEFDALTHVVEVKAQDWADALSQAIHLAGSDWTVSSIDEVLSAKEQRDPRPRPRSE